MKKLFIIYWFFVLFIIASNTVNALDYKDYGFTNDEVENDLFQYIEIFYNRKRMYSTLNYMSPISYRIQNQACISAS